MILGIKIRKTNGSFSLCQSHYIEKMLKKFNHFDVTPVRTRYDPRIYLKRIRGLVFPKLSILKSWEVWCFL